MFTRSLRDRFPSLSNSVLRSLLATAVLVVLLPLSARAHTVPNGSGCHPHDGDGTDHAHLSVTGGAVSEAAGTVTFHVRCAPCASIHATTHWSTMNGTAVAPGDYTALVNHFIQIGNGSVGNTPDEDWPVPVTINNDTDFEPNEFFSLVLNTGPGEPSVGEPCLFIDNTSAMATIENDDPENTPPTVAATTNPVVVNEGQTANNTGTFSDAQGNATVTLSASIGSIVKNDGAGTWSWSFGTTNGPAQSQTVTITATDDMSAMATATFGLTVNNVAPTVAAPTTAPEPSDEGASVTASADFTDPAGALDAPFTCTVDHGDGSGALAGTVVGFTCTGPSHIYADNDSFDVEVCVTDKDLGTGCETSTHVVDNVPPTVDLPVTSPEPSDEGSAVTASADFTDPAGVLDEPFTCTVDHGDGSAALAGTVAGFTCTGPSYTYADNGSYDVEICVTDKDAGTGCETSTHVVENVDPTITASTNSAEECGDTPDGAPVDITVDFTDPGFDSAVAGTLEHFDNSTIDWGDGTPVETATVDKTPGSAGVDTTGTASGTHIYASGGIYTITVTIEDDDGGTDSTTLTALVTGVGLTPTGLLGVVGTDWKDVVNIQKKKASIEVQGPFLGPGKAAFPVSSVLQLYVLTCDGDDQIHVNHDVVVPAILDGGPDNDHIDAGGGPTILLGAEGADHLVGGNANDEVYGGPGDDNLNGGKGVNTLDGGPDFDKCNAAQGTNTLVSCEQ